LKVSGDVYTPFRVKTAARTATPKTPRSSRSELFVPEAIPASCGGTEPITLLATVGKQSRR
jgi:hypothetical protein